MAEPVKQVIDSLLQEIMGKADKISKDARFYRKAFLVYTIAGAGFSAATTFLIGAGQFSERQWPSVIALATSAVGTVVAAWGATFRHREMWVQKNGVLSQLNELISRLRYGQS